MDFLHKLHYMKYAKVWVAISVVLTVVSLIAALTMGFNKGIDFTGGTLLDLQFDQTITQADLTAAVQASIGGEVIVQSAEVKGAESPTASEFIVRMHELTQAEREKLVQDLGALGQFHVISEDQVSATVSRELTTRAILAVAVAAVLQIIYLSLRFEFKFGVTAVAALLHDILITIGLVSVLQIQINSSFVAAILTILGYSINDTVIVFDRIRENLAQKKKGETLVELTTRSIQEVITRSIYTVLTVLITLAALLLWGGASIHEFALTLFLGLGVGMYSSIFIAAALWLFWQQKAGDQKRPAPSTKAART